MAVAEISLIGSRCIGKGHCNVINSGEGSASASKVGSTVKERMARAPLGCLLIADKVLVETFSALPFDLPIIHMYTPTAQLDNSAVEKFYEEVGEALNQTKRRNLLIVLPDCDGKKDQGRKTDSAMGLF